jgi:hypothetical protein
MNSEIWHGPGRTVTYGVGGDRRRRWSIQISAVPFVLIQISEAAVSTRARAAEHQGFVRFSYETWRSYSELRKR